MIIKLKRLPDTLHGPKGDGYNGKIPLRARLLAPDAADSLLRLDHEVGHLLVCTDLFRGADASLAAYKAHANGQKTAGVQRPGFSGHGYGLSVDFDLTLTLHNLGSKYAQFCDLLAERGWWCHRRDLDPGASESWHFNYLGAKFKQFLAGVDPQNHATWANAAEAAIQDRYGAQMALSNAELQQALAGLGLYSGAIDGKLGPKTTAGIKAFQHTWFLQEDGVPGKTTQRTLAYVGAALNIAELPNV